MHSWILGNSRIYLQLCYSSSYSIYIYIFGNIVFKIYIYYFYFFYYFVLQASFRGFAFPFLPAILSCSKFFFPVVFFSLFPQPSLDSNHSSSELLLMYCTIFFCFHLFVLYFLFHFLKEFEFSIFFQGFYIGFFPLQFLWGVPCLTSLFEAFYFPVSLSHPILRLTVPFILFHHSHLILFLFRFSLWGFCNFPFFIYLTPHAKKMKLSTCRSHCTLHVHSSSRLLYFLLHFFLLFLFRQSFPQFFSHLSLLGSLFFTFSLFSSSYLSSPPPPYVRLYPFLFVFIIFLVFSFSPSFQSSASMEDLFPFTVFFSCFSPHLPFTSMFKVSFLIAHSMSINP